MRSSIGFDGIEPEHWVCINSVRPIVRDAFCAIGLPEYGPHSFRHMLAQYGTQVCRTSEEMKAWSQNLGHWQMRTTIESYADVPPPRQAAVLAGLHTVGMRPPAPEAFIWKPLISDPETGGWTLPRSVSAGLLAQFMCLTPSKGAGFDGYQKA